MQKRRQLYKMNQIQKGKKKQGYKQHVAKKKVFLFRDAHFQTIFYTLELIIS